MRSFIVVAFAIASPSIASAQTPVVSQPQTVYSTANTDIGTLLDNPATKTILMKHIPTVVNNDQITMARGMTLKAIQSYASDVITDDLLAKIDADLTKVPMVK